MMWNTTFTPWNTAQHTKHWNATPMLRYGIHTIYVETCSRATRYQGTSTSLPLVRASVWVGCRRTRCLNMCVHLMRRDSRMEKVWRVPVFVCNIITSPWVMTQNRERETEAERERQRNWLIELCEVCFFRCGFWALTHVLAGSVILPTVVQYAFRSVLGQEEVEWKCDFVGENIKNQMIKVTFRCHFQS